MLPDEAGGHDFVIVASGPSLTKEQVDYSKGKAKVIVVNDNYKMAPWADYLYACDSHWWEWHRKYLINFKGKKFTQDQAWPDAQLEELRLEQNFTVLKSVAKPGLSLEPGIIHQGANSGYQAINLAYHLGASRAILIGYDQGLSADGKAHWFGDHPNGVKSNYSSWVKNYESLAEHAKEIGFPIINCSIETTLTCFDRRKLEDVL